MRKIAFKLDILPMLAALVLFVGVVGFLRTIGPSNSGSSYTDKPDVIMVTLDPSLTRFEEAWRVEIGRKFHNAVAILVHGGDFLPGEWIVGSQPGSGHVELATDVVKRVQAQYPGRTVILLACNPGHIKLGIPGVYYATSSVWCIPDRNITDENAESRDAQEILGPSRWQMAPDVLGNIYEFVAE